MAPLILAIGLLLASHSVAAGAATAAEKPPKWQKFDHQGNLVELKMGPWHCARDNHTGLVWEVKSWHENAHYYKAGYSYYEPLGKVGVADGGSCQQGFEWYPCDVSDYIKTINDERYCGIDNWRLPTLEELKTLVYRKNIAGKLLINPYIFPRTTRALYMTSTTTMVDGRLKIAMMDFWQLKIEQRSADVVVNARLVAQGPRQ